MFSEVNSLVFLLIFLVYAAVCMIVCCRAAAPCSACSSGWATAKKLLLCGLIALLLTVTTIYFWYLVILLLLIAMKYLWGRCGSKGVKAVIAIGIAGFMALIAIAGIQLMLSRSADDDSDNDDAVLEEVTENGMAAVTTEEWKKGVNINGKLSAFGTCSYFDQGAWMDL